MQSNTEQAISPAYIMQTGTGFLAAKVLLTAVKLELFTLLAKGSLSAKDIQVRLGLHERGLYDYLDALVALRFLHRSGIMESAVYSNTPETDLFLDKDKDSYVGGILEMSNSRLYPFWGRLEDALKTGEPQNETRDGGKPLFEELYADENRLREFISAMAGAQLGNFAAFAKQFDFSPYKTLCDIGGAGAQLSTQVGLHHPHMQCISFDLPKVTPLAEETIRKMGLGDRVKIQVGDFFKDEFPAADIITMGNILHDWGTEDKMMLMQKAYTALPEGGALIAIESIIDDDRSENANGLLMSLNMLVETDGGYNFSHRDFAGWAKGIGFSSTSIMPLRGSSSAVIAIK